MYEFRDAEGGVVTVRSLKTIERLLTSSTIKAKTLFRAESEVSFVAACEHEVTRRLAAVLGMPFSPLVPTVTSEHKRDGILPLPMSSHQRAPIGNSTSDQKPNLDDLGRASRATQPVALVTNSVPAVTRRAPLAPSLDSAPSSRPSLKPPPVNMGTVYWDAPAATETASVSRKIFWGKLTLAAFSWLAAAVIAGLLTFAAARSFIGPGLGAAASLCVTIAVCYFGGGQLRQMTVDGGKPVWFALAIVCLIGIFTSSGSLLFIALGACALVLGWRRKKKI